MFSDKKNIQQLVALLEAHEVRKVVLCPGSRNAPIIQSFTSHPSFSCYPVTDGRSAAFFAIGLALHGGKPAAVCCTSGSTLADMHSAITEAYYQQVPLVVISAYCPAGQTLPPTGISGVPFKHSVNLPEINTEADERYCNRLINETLLELNHHGKGPVHINIPISEPFSRFTAETLPDVRAITRYQGLNVYDRDYNGLIDKLNRYGRRMVIAGQMNLIYLFEKKSAKLLYKHFVWLTEHLGNRTVPGIPVKQFDTVLYTQPEEMLGKLMPELVITYGGHIVSSRLKQFLRKYPPREHWHISPDGEAADPFGALTTVIEMDPFEFLEKIAYLLETHNADYPRLWERIARELPLPDFPYSGMAAIGILFKSLPAPCALHLGNGSVVRYAQLFTLPDEVEVCCNRGVNGIDGSLSTAIGYSVCSDKLNFVVLGDLSFFHDMNALWNANYGCNLRIMLLNNGGGGELSEAMHGAEWEERTQKAVAATHTTSAKGWAEERGFAYFAIHDDAELAEIISLFTRPEPYPKPMLAEVFTDMAEDVRLLNEYYHRLRGEGTGSASA